LSTSKRLALILEASFMNIASCFEKFEVRSKSRISFSRFSFLKKENRDKRREELFVVFLL